MEPPTNLAEQVVALAESVKSVGKEHIQAADELKAMMTQIETFSQPIVSVWIYWLCRSGAKFVRPIGPTQYNAPPSRPPRRPEELYISSLAAFKIPSANA